MTAPETCSPKTSLFLINPKPLRIFYSSLVYTFDCEEVIILMSKMTDLSYRQRARFVKRKIS